MRVFKVFVRDKENTVLLKFTGFAEHANAAIAMALELAQKQGIPDAMIDQVTDEGALSFGDCPVGYSSVGL